MESKSLVSPKALIALVSFVAVMSAAVVDFGQTAPGPLMAAHARVEGLASDRSCSDCHGGWRQSMTASCVECHELVQVHLDHGLGLHGALEPAVAENCAGCHSDHHGASFLAVNDLSFARAGVPDVLAFDHARVGFEMGGAHLDLNCTECHEHADAEIVPEGAHRYMALSSDCASCHEDVHQGHYSRSCASCHTQNAFDEHRFVGHDAFLELRGGHAQLACAECHADGTTHSLTQLRGPADLRPEHRACADCHGMPHEPSFVETATGGTCASCHQPDHTSFQEDSTELTAGLHAASGFPLEAPHHEQDCASCHAPELPYEERYPGRTANSCSACHDDVHSGQFGGLVVLGGSVDEKGCLACHERTHFEPHAFDAAAHAATDLPLEGAHLEAECASCHAPDPGLGGAARFHGIDHRCDTCHGDAHAGFFDKVLAAHPADDGMPDAVKHGDCARCHDAGSFGTAHLVGTNAEFDHAFWTGYELTGAHAAAECTTCHVPAEEPDALGRSFGRVAETFGVGPYTNLAGCATCHEDVHEGTFDRKRLPKKMEGRGDCARCHSTNSFREQPHGFDHGRWTGWPLQDAHAALDCASCHEPLRRPDEVGRTWGRAAGTDCKSCHQSPHGDQFERPRPKDCRRCHDSAASFNELSFDHDLESTFPLDEAHQKVECAACHKPAEDTAIIQYRPLPKDCVDCHGVHEKALRRRQRKR